MISPISAETFSISLFHLTIKFLVILDLRYTARIFDNDIKNRLRTIAKIRESNFATKGFSYILNKNPRNVSLTVVAADHNVFML